MMMTQHPAKIVCSFSGGKTSAYMAMKIKQEWKETEVKYVFANTGQENEETLKFVRAVDEEFQLGVVWVEAVVNQGAGEATAHRVVSFETACRDGSLFADMCAKYGISNHSFPHCTRELKLAPITSYLKSVGWRKKDYLTAIGIRTDERGRAGKKGCVYPLIDEWPVDKQDINDFWEEHQYTLELKEHQGNCKWCWKKSDRKLFRIAKDTPEFFLVPAELEAKYARSGPLHRKDPQAPENVFFRKRRSAKDILALAEILDSVPLFYDDDDSGGCSESCEYAEADTEEDEDDNPVPGLRD
jgi:hypothetical protein